MGAAGGKPTGNLLAGKPNQIVAIDLVGPIDHEISGGKVYIFTLIDHFSKFAEAVVLRDTTASTVWTAFYERWLTVWGCPVILLSDNGPQFASVEFKENCRALGD